MIPPGWNHGGMEESVRWKEKRGCKVNQLHYYRSHKSRISYFSKRNLPLGNSIQSASPPSPQPQKPATFKYPSIYKYLRQFASLERSLTLLRCASHPDLSPSTSSSSGIAGGGSMKLSISSSAGRSVLGRILPSIPGRGAE